jgi:hypothetical protein
MKKQSTDQITLLAVEPDEGDRALLEVKEWILNECKKQSKTPPQLFGKIIRQALDEAIDGPRTGRWEISQLEKTEKTYVGTKVEIVTRAALNLKRGKLDAEIQGHQVDIKWSKKSAWEIPSEAVDHICLVIGTNDEGTSFSVGLVRCSEDRLNQGKNKDGKRTLSKVGKCHIVWLVEGSRLEPNFIGALPPEVRGSIMRQETAKERVRKFLIYMAGRPFPRSAIETVIHTVTDDIIHVPVDEIEGFIERLNLGK